MSTFQGNSDKTRSGKSYANVYSSGKLDIENQED